MAASFASSDGWMPMPAIPNHRRALLTGGLKSTATSAHGDHPYAAPDKDRLPVRPVVDAHDDTQDGQAERRPHALFDQEQIGRWNLSSATAADAL